MLLIRSEIQAIEEGRAERDNNLLSHAPHTARQVTSDEWNRPYTREKGAYPAPWSKMHKFWPHVARVDNVFGDRNPMCLCPPVSAFEEG